MGLFDFVKDAGDTLSEKVLGSNSNDEVTKSAEIPQERLDELRREQISSAIAQLDIDGEVVSVDVKGSVAVLNGRAPDQEALEKMVLCAGNQYGIEQVDCKLEVDASEQSATKPLEAAAPTEAVGSAPTPTVDRAPEEPTFYTVQPGDTLGKIAQEHYGAASKYTLIFEANQPMLTDPDKIYPGQKLRIPRV